MIINLYRSMIYWHVGEFCGRNEWRTEMSDSSFGERQMRLSSAVAGRPATSSIFLFN